MTIIKHKTIFFTLSAIFLLASLIIIFTKGLKPSIEFTGGTLIEVQSQASNLEPQTSTSTQLQTSDPSTSQPLNPNFSQPTVEAVITQIAPEATASVQSYGENGYIIRTSFLGEETQQALIRALEDEGASVTRVSAIGPTIGSELKSKAVVAVIIVSLLTVLFIAYAFRKISEPVSSWKYGIVAIITLLHDIIIPAGLFALIGYEMDLLFVIALLAILGYSINDTIVVFDRVRENLKNNKENKVKDEPFSETVGKSLKETISRSFNTSFTTILVLLALYVAGPSSTNHFALTLLVGAIAGTYSSIFLAAPLLVLIEKYQKKPEPKEEKKK